MADSTEKIYASGFRVNDGNTYYYRDDEAVKNDASYKELRQISWMAGAREWTADTTYKENMRVRCQGWIFKALTDTTDCPYETISDETGLPIVNENYQLLTTEKINEENWAQIEEAYFLSNYDLTIELQEAQNTISEQATTIKDLQKRLEAVEAFLSSNIFVTNTDTDSE